ncbi:hypothetical protein QIS99_03275 [Streptomyces sp. B-S-A8]|uniref:HNH endonuclease n=1 Tax=Streptomyces solicavernae TaxID=3043614 RepID=A0ABT6RLD1_9ACTN|nr:hypothetical protein [Streptomyces sp. B-S-A8]MDI3385242.1 hypothetical protein [Streptomyces sp. B-S-A8]
MSLNDECHGTTPSAAEINAQIRKLWSRADGRLSDDQRREYARLVTLWATAVRDEVVEAA